MPKLSQMAPSGSYIKKEDLPTPALVTMKEFIIENVAMTGEPEEKKVVVYFLEVEKGLILNATNRILLEAIFSTDDTDLLAGKKIVLFNDKSVVYQGKVGGVRIRAPKNQPASPPPPAPAPAPAPVPPPPAVAGGEAGEDDVPF